MQIVFMGNFRHAWCTETHIALSLEALGHTVLRLQEDKVTAEQVPARAEGADLFLWQRTVGWLKGDARRMLAEIACPTAAYHLDLYAGLKRSRDIDEHPWWRCKYVFSADGGSGDFWQAHGVNHHWLPPGVYAGGCYLAEPGPERYDVVFVGSGPGYHAEWPYRERLIAWLEGTYGARFTRFGRGAPVECVREADLNRLYASTKVVIGDSLCLGFAHPRYWSDRVTETLGRGGFLIHPRIAGLVGDGGHFRDHEHLVTYEYGDFEGLQRKIDYYLAHDAEREHIRRAGHEHVKARHTYAHRMVTMLETVARGEGWTE